MPSMTKTYGQSATGLRYKVLQLLIIKSGRSFIFIPALSLSRSILTAAQNALQSWLTQQGKIGRDVARSAIMAALHVQGVQRVELQEPASDLVIDDTQSARCTSFAISKGGTDE